MPHEPAISLLQAPLFVAMDAPAFKKYGMEVRYIRTVGGVPETVATVQAKLVHARTLSPPSSFVAQKAGFKMLFDMTSLGIDYISSGLGVKKSSLLSNREEVKQFLMALR